MAIVSTVATQYQAKGKLNRRGDRVRRGQMIKLETEALDLKVAGWSYERIGQHQKCSGKTAWERVQRAIASVRYENAVQHREMDLARIEKLYELAYREAAVDRPLVQQGRVIQGHIDTAHKLNAIDRCAKLLERKAKLLGLDAPTRHAVAIITEEQTRQIIETLEIEERKLDALEATIPALPPVPPAESTTVKRGWGQVAIGPGDG